MEINIPALEAMAVSKQRPRVSVDEYTLADGRLVNLAAMNLGIDALTDEQARYLSSWQEGT